MRVFRRKNASTPERRSQVADIPRASSYHYSARRLDSQKPADRQTALSNERQNNRGKKLFIGFGAIVFIIGFLFLFSTITPTPTIKQSNQNSSVNVNDYTKTVADILRSSSLNRSKLTLDREKIINNLKQSYPGITSVQVATPLLSRSVQITLETTEPALRFASGGGSIYVVSADGRVISDGTKDISAKADLPLVLDKTSVPVSLGKPALTSQQVGYIKQVIAQSVSRGLQVDSMQLVAGGGELDVRFKDLSYFVKFNFFEDARKSSGAFFAVKDRLEIENSPPKEYIDVRVSERAYVK